MSMTKTRFHDAICERQMINEGEYFAFAAINEKAFDWFPEERMAHDGYSEYDSQTKDFAIIDEDLPF